MKMRRGLFLLSVLVCFFEQSRVLAQSNEILAKQRAALTDITETADRICSSIPLSGSSQSAELSGQAKAELTGVIKKVADLGIQGAGKFQSAEFSNVLQQDLAKAIQQNADCKQTVFKLLLDRMLPASTTAPSSSRPGATAVVPSGGAPSRSVKQLLHSGDAIVVDIQTPLQKTQKDENFFKTVGGSVSFTLQNYDPQSGSGDMGATSFGYAGGRITATDNSLSIANPSAMGCSGSFRLSEPGLLRGRLTCRWGNPFPSQTGTIAIGQ